MTTAFDAKSSAADSSAHVTSQDSADTCPPIAVLPRTMTPISVTTISIVRRPRDASRARRAAALRLAVVIGPATAPEAREDRKSGGMGKGWSVRVALGGRRISKKKNN